MTYREIQFGFGACTVCDQIVAWGKRRTRGMPLLLGHGPRNVRCPGSGQPGKPWLAASRLPTWDQMSDLDKGAALMHVWKRQREGGVYAKENYPAEYIEHPNLIGLPRDAACHHAVAVAGRNDDAQDRLGINEWDRLYNLALDEGRRILDSRKLWGVRYEHGSVLPCETEDYARRCATDLHAVALLQRTEVGGEWTVIEDLLSVDVVADLHWIRQGDSILWAGQWVEVLGNDSEERRTEDHGGYHVRIITLLDGTIMELPPYWVVEQNPESTLVPARRRAAKPEGASR